MARRVSALFPMVLIFGASLFQVGGSVSAQSDTIPGEIPKFIKWCSERGLDVKDSAGTSCNETIAGVMDLYLIEIAITKGVANTACKSLSDRLNKQASRRPIVQ